MSASHSKTSQFVPFGRRAPWGTGLLAAWLIILAALLASPPALAQDQDLRALVDRVERLQREITTLQRTVYQGAPPPAEASAGDLNEAQAARLAVQIQQLETALRGVTGELEQQSHQIRQLTQRMDKLVADVDNRLQRIEQRLAGDGGGLAAAPQAAAATTAPAADNGALASSDPPRVLGTITAADRAAFDQSLVQNEASAAAAPALTGAQNAAGTAQDQYAQAFQLLRQTKYDDAETALAAFLAQHPNDPLAGNAKYWLGETYYVRGQFAEAAVTFAEGFQAYPASPKAPDNLLKLGKSLAELGKVPDACATFSELVRRYPGAPATILQQARQDQQRLNCA